MYYLVDLTHSIELEYNYQTMMHVMYLVYAVFENESNVFDAIYDRGL